MSEFRIQSALLTSLAHNLFAPFVVLANKSQTQQNGFCVSIAKQFYTFEVLVVNKIGGFSMLLNA